MKKLKALSIAALCVTMAGCGSVNGALAERRESVEIYHIWDVKTSAAPDVIIKATADGIASNTNSINQNRPLMKPGPLPENPGRFEIVDLGASLQGTGMGSLMVLAGGGQMSLKTAKCDGAIWSSQATRTVSGSDQLKLTTCLYRYKAGYQVNQYALFTKVSGGLSQIGREAAQALVGTPEQWLNKTIIDTVRSVEKGVGATPKYIEGQPALGQLPAIAG